MPIDDVTDAVIRRAIDLHRRFGPGLLESAYADLLIRLLQRDGWHVEREHPVAMEYDGIRIPNAFRADAIVDHRVVLEIKATEKHATVFSRQLLTYLRLLDLRVGLLLNFGAEYMRDGIRRVVNDFGPVDGSRLRVNRPPSGPRGDAPSPPD